MSQTLKDQVAVVTGAARGLGARVAEALAAQGMRVALLDVRGDEVQEQAARMGAGGGPEVLPLQVDLADEAGVTEAVERVVDRWGRIDVLVGNAGVREVAPVWEMSVDAWDRVQNSNLRGQFFCTREVLKQDLLKRGEGALIFISSLAGVRSVPGGASYCASKWGVRGFAASVAQDLKSTRIRVTTLLPGMLLTPMARESEVWHLGLDWLDPDIVAQTIVFCLKQDSDTVVPEMIVQHRAQL